MVNMNDYANAQEPTKISKPAAGAYLMKVATCKETKSKNGKAMFALELDFPKGDFANYCADTAERAGFWPITTFMVFEGNAMYFFKQKIKAIESANKGYTFAGSADELVGKFLYVTLGEEHYTNKKGYDDYNLQVADFITLDDFKAKKYTIPEAKVREKKEPAPVVFDPAEGVYVQDNDDLPF